MKKINFIFIVLFFISVNIFSEQEKKHYINEGDIVTIRVLRHPELSGRHKVSMFGEILFPLIGELKVIGMSTNELERHLIQNYIEYIRKPVIRVTLEQVNAIDTDIQNEIYVSKNYIYVSGEKVISGVYPIKKEGEELLKILTRSITPKYGMPDLSHVAIIRDKNEGFEIINFNNLVINGDLSQNLYVFPGDMIFVGVNKYDNIRILGEVYLPGSYHISQKVNILEALTLSGGLTDDASYRNLKIIHTGTNPPYTESINLDRILSKKWKGNLPMIDKGDVVFVNKGIWHLWGKFVSTTKDIVSIGENGRIIRGWKTMNYQPRIPIDRSGRLDNM